MLRKSSFAADPEYLSITGAAEPRRLIIGCFRWKTEGAEAAFARAVAFDDEWPKKI